MAQRRINFIYNPQSEYWLQRMSAQQAVDSAQFNKANVLEELNWNMKMFDAMKPDLLYSKTDKNGTLWNVYQNPLTGKHSMVKVGDDGLFDEKGQQVVWQHYDDVTGIMSVQYADGRIDRQTAGTPKGLSGGGLDGSSVDNEGDFRKVVRSAPVGQQESLFAALDTYQQAGQLIEMLEIDGVDTGPASGRLQSGLSKIFGVGADFQEFQSSSTQLAAVYRKMLTGVSSNPGEQEQFAKFLPDANKQESKNITDLKLIQDTAKRYINNRLGVNLETVVTGVVAGEDDSDPLKLF